jgi:5-methylcytosine-specific restriction endonuclease McrA
VKEHRKNYAQTRCPIRRKRISQAYTARIRAIGSITTDDVQAIYENNIKRFGCLTCYLCFERIAFGEDSLDHKLPVARGGHNTSDNLGVAHKKCNMRKQNRTPEEYWHDTITFR